MKKKILAILLMLIGISDIIYWFVYWNLNEKLALSNFNEFKVNYINSLPSFIKPLYETKPPLSTILILVVFVLSGFLFWKSSKSGKVFRVAAIVAFILAFWELFSLM